MNRILVVGLLLFVGYGGIAEFVLRPHARAVYAAFCEARTDWPELWPSAAPKRPEFHPRRFCARDDWRASDYTWADLWGGQTARDMRLELERSVYYRGKEGKDADALFARCLDQMQREQDTNTPATACQEVKMYLSRP